MNRNLRTLLAAACCCCMATSASAATTAYGYILNAKDGKRGFVSFDVETPQKLNYSTTDRYGNYHPIAGEYVDGKVYTFRGELDDMYGTISLYDYSIYDATTFKRLDSKFKSGARVVDMTYDYTTNTMYGLIEDKATSGIITPTSLCVVDMANGNCRVIGSPGELKAIDGNGKEDTDGLVTLACDAQGQLYGMTHYRYLYKVDKFTGAVTSAAPRHKLGTVEQFQSMAFDAEGHLWWAQQHPSYGHFCEIDLTTGVPGGFVDFQTDYEKLNKLGDDAQLTGLFFKDKQVNATAPLAATDFKAVVDEKDPYTVHLTWTLPTQDYSGNATTVTGVRIYCIGVPEPIAILNGAETAFTYDKAPNGNVTFEVIPFNESGNGFPAFADAFAGMDRLNAVQSLAASIADGVVTVKWEKPVSTVNGGYADYDAITYNVFRKEGVVETQVAEGLAATTFTETLDKTGGYSYIVEPVCGGQVGERAESNTVVLAGVASLPYTCGFEDSDDTSLWTIKNCANNTNNDSGWHFGVKSYVHSGKKTAYAHTAGASNLGDDWLISPAIEFPAAGEYIVEFYGNGSNFDKATLDVCLGTDPENLDSFSQVLYSIDNDYLYDSAASGWKHVEVKFSVAKGGNYHVGFHNKSRATYSNTRIDDLSVKKYIAAVSDVVSDDANAPVEYFNLQGMKVDNPAAGLYIRRQGDKVSKVMIK